MELGRFLWKDTGSGNTGSPALIEATNEGAPGYAVIGKTVSPSDTNAVTALGKPHNTRVAEDETVVWVPANVLDRLRDS